MLKEPPSQRDRVKVMLTWPQAVNECLDPPARAAWARERAPTGPALTSRAAFGFEGLAAASRD